MTDRRDFFRTSALVAASVVVPGGEDAYNLSYSLEVHLPAGYPWRSTSPQEPNSVETGYGVIRATTTNRERHHCRMG